jgi:predicted TPR repeat methyltransferase
LHVRVQKYNLLNKGKALMSGGNHEGHLGKVYDAKRPEDVASLYDTWASTYDREMAAAGYRHPSICLALLTRHIPQGTTPLLDAGAGTGLVGEWLGIVGYPDVEALDISSGMLAVAEKKGVYTNLHQAVLGAPLCFSDNAYGGIISAGVFTSGHVGVEGLGELVRICRSGGKIILTVKNTLWQDGFAAEIALRQSKGQLKLVEETEPYVSMPGETGTIPSRAIVLQVL